jgi:small conductance mechanosensitive channel
MDITLDSVQAFAEKHILPIGLDLLFGIVLFVVGRWCARWFVRGAKSVMEGTGIDVSLRKFLADVLYAVLLVAVVTASLDTIGVRTTAVVAVLGAAGIAVGLALQGSLSNFAAGVMIIVMRPYKVGDHVAINKYTGRVDAIRVFHTVLITADNREVIIPNGQIIAQPIENLTVLGLRRVDIEISVAHGTDLREVKHAIEQIVSTDVRVALSPGTAIELYEVGGEALKLNVRPWTQVEHYAAVATDTVERMREAFETRGFKFTAALVRA